MYLYFQGDSNEEVYDSDDSYVSEEEDNEEEDDGLSNNFMVRKNKDNTEHTNPNSYSWNVLRLAIIKITVTKLQEAINIAGVEIQGI